MPGLVENHPGSVLRIGPSLQGETKIQISRSHSPAAPHVVGPGDGRGGNDEDGTHLCPPRHRQAPIAPQTPPPYRRGAARSRGATERHPAFFAVFRGGRSARTGCHGRLRSGRHDAGALAGQKSEVFTKPVSGGVAWEGGVTRTKR